MMRHADSERPTASQDHARPITDIGRQAAREVRPTSAGPPDTNYAVYDMWTEAKRLEPVHFELDCRLHKSLVPRAGSPSS